MDTPSLQHNQFRNLKYFLADAAKHKETVHQLDSIGEFLQANVKNIFFVRLDSRCGEYFPEYTNYFGRPLSINKLMYRMSNYGNLSDDGLTNFLIDEAGLNHSKFQMSVYYKYAIYGRLCILVYI